MKNMIKAVIFDLNGIFIQSPRLSERFHDKFGVDKEKFIAALNEIMAEVRRPNAGDAFAYWKPYLDKWGLKLTRSGFFVFWFIAEEEILELVESAKQIKNKGIDIFILSNNFKERADYYEKKFHFLKIFNKVYYSWQTGFVKPDPESFKKLLEQNNLKPEECIYFDNSEKNVGVAENLGIKSFLFENITGFKNILKRYNLI